MDRCRKRLAAVRSARERREISLVALLERKTQGIRTRQISADLRRSYVSNLLAEGTEIFVVQQMAGHRHPKTTMRYDRARGSLDRHATYIVAAYLAGAAR